MQDFFVETTLKNLFKQILYYNQGRIQNFKKRGSALVY